MINLHMIKWIFTNNHFEYYLLKMLDPLLPSKYVLLELHNRCNFNSKLHN